MKKSSEKLSSGYRINRAGDDAAGLAISEKMRSRIKGLNQAISKTSMVRGSFDAIRNRLEHKITNLPATSENLTEAESSIRDTDMASEMMNYTSSTFSGRQLSLCRLR